MKTYTLVAVFGTLLTVIHGHPLSDSQNQSGQNVVQGVFVPADVYKALQEKANQNQGIEGKSELQPNSIETPSNQQPVLSSSATILSSSQPIITNPPISNQPTIVSSQSLANQPSLSQPLGSQVYVLSQQPSQSQPIMAGQPSQNQPIYISQQTPSQNQAAIILSQPKTNQPIYLSTQSQSSSSQPVYTTMLLSNGQLVQLATNSQSALYTNPSSTIQKPVQSQGTLYTVVPVQQVASPAYSG